MTDDVDYKALFFSEKEKRISAERKLRELRLESPNTLHPGRVGEYDFNSEVFDFESYVDQSINNIEHKRYDLFEREEIENEIVSLAMTPKEESEKPICVTVWSGRGSGKTELIRQIVTKSPILEERRHCGRLLVFDAKYPNMPIEIPEQISCDSAKSMWFLVVLIGHHLCQVFGNRCVQGVEFTSRATVIDLWKKNQCIPQSLVTKMESLRKGQDAYDWWRTCTRGFLRDGDSDGPDPIIFIDTAVTLAVESVVESPRTKREHASPTKSSSATESIETQVSHVAYTESKDPQTPPPRKHQQSQESRYLILELLMMRIPNKHAMVVFGTRQGRQLPAPLDLQTHVNQMSLPPLKALSEKAAARLLLRYSKNQQDHQVADDPLRHLELEEVRFLRTVYAVTAGIPRMLVSAFSSRDVVLRSTWHETWESIALVMYNDVSNLVGGNLVEVQCLAKAVLIAAVCDVKMESEFTKIPGEKFTWDFLQWSSVAFLAPSDEEGPQSQYYRIPRLLWQKEGDKIHDWVKRQCRFNVHNLLPTIRVLYECAGDASATSSGVAWEKMFASALVARFFALCWMQDSEPKETYIGLDMLIPQPPENAADIKTLEKVEVCLVNGIIANDKEEAFAMKSRGGKGSLDPKAIHANWEHNSAHHDMILPVRLKNGTEHMLYAVSARNGHHKTESELVKMKQHLENKTSNRMVAGVIQALNPRLKQSGRELTGVFKELAESERYAEVVITKGHVHYVLGCFA